MNRFVFPAFVVFEKLTHPLFLGNVRQVILIFRRVHARFGTQVGHDVRIREAITTGGQKFAIALRIVLVLRISRSIVRIFITVETKSVAIGLFAGLRAKGHGVLGIARFPRRGAVPVIIAFAFIFLIFFHDFLLFQNGDQFYDHVLLAVTFFSISHYRNW
jgi:hypothetical protein